MAIIQAQITNETSSIRGLHTHAVGVAYLRLSSAKKIEMIDANTRERKAELNETRRHRHRHLTHVNKNLTTTRRRKKKPHCRYIKLFLHQASVA